MKPKKRPASERYSRRLSLLHEVGKTLASAGASPEALPAIMSKIRAFYRPVSVTLLLLDEKSQELRAETALGSEPKDAPKEKGTGVKLGEGVAGWVAQHGEPLLVDNSGGRPRRGRAIPSGPAGAGYTLGVPVRGRQAILGVVQLASGRSDDRLSEEEIPTLTALADYLAIALENARLTISDHCTGLFNARHLNHVLEAEIYRSARFGHEFSVVFMDLDHFKRVNDTYGHLLGSKLLGMIGDLIKRELRLIDSAFRYGGDEFVLLLPQTSRSNALVMVKRLREALNSRDFSLGEGRDFRLTASYGVASFPADATTVQDLLRRADEAMYCVKSTTRDGIAVSGGESAA